MIRLLSIYFTGTHTAIEVQRETSRSASGRDAAAVIQAMPDEDRAVLVAFCRAVVACSEGDCTALAKVRE